MRLQEQRLWDTFKGKLKAASIWHNRIENLVKEGMPDALIQGKITAFVETKAVDEYPKRNTTRVLGNKGLSQDQKNWFLGFIKAGGIAYILARVGSFDVFLIEGEWYDEVNEFTREQLYTHATATNWTDIIKVFK